MLQVPPGRRKLRRAGEWLVTQTSPLTFVYKLVFAKDLYGSENYMNSTIVLLCTCSSEKEGRLVAEALVQSKLAACVNMLCGVQSIYRWEGEVEKAAEVLLLIKSTADRFDE